MLATAFVAPFTAAVTTLQYLDQRMRKEAYDVELMAQAGITGVVSALAPAGRGPPARPVPGRGPSLLRRELLQPEYHQGNLSSSCSTGSTGSSTG